MTTSRVGVNARRAQAEGRQPKGIVRKPISWQGQTLSQAEWSRRLGIAQITIRERLRRGLPLDIVFSKERVKPRPIVKRAMSANPALKQILREKLDAHLVEYPSGCWGWSGYHNSAEVACVPVSLSPETRKFFTARQASWLAYRGEIPAHRSVKVSCKHIWCINPKHLRLSMSEDERNAAKYEHTRRWYKANPEKARARWRAYRERNKEKIRAYRADHYAKNKEKVKEQVRSWKAEHPERVRMQKRRSYLKKAGRLP